MGRAVRHMGGTGDNDMLAPWHAAGACACGRIALPGEGGGVMIRDKSDIGEDVGDCFGK